MLTLYGIPNCDTVRKARRWLKEQAIDYRFHDYKKLGIDEPPLSAWADQLGWEALLNRRGTSWRKLAESDREGVDRDKAIRLMLANHSLIKRPLLENASGRLLGFSDESYQDFFRAKKES